MQILRTPPFGRLGLAAWLLTGAGAAYADQYVFDTPSDDRWHYPFNFTPGIRPKASCFGATGLDGFNDRDGVLIIAWDTSAQIPPGRGPASYHIRSFTVRLTNERGAEYEVDLTRDEWFTFDVNGDGTVNADGIPRGEPGDLDGESDDVDPGRPVELFGAGFGPFTSFPTWNEFTFYEGSSGQQNLPRDPFPFVFQDRTGDMLHCEDNVAGLHNRDLPNPVESFTPRPWAIGNPIDYSPGQQTVPFTVVFDVNLSQARNRVRRRYFQEQLDQGRVVLIVTSMVETTKRGEPSGFPSYFTKEGLDLDPLAEAPLLEIDVHVFDRRATEVEAVIDP